uniref:phosphopantetheine-binding protein n=1 Tax=Trinickia mobilis TaxID=2816356 RepID=UPI001A8F4F5C
GREYEAPQGETETLIAQIWEQVLGVARVSRADNFFELGGHSLLAMRVVERMLAANLIVDARAFFITANLAELATAARKMKEIEL